MAEVGACALQDCFDLLVDCVVGCSLTQPPQYSHRARCLGAAARWPKAVLRDRGPRHHSHAVKLSGVGALKPGASALTIWQQTTRNLIWPRAWGFNAGREVCGADSERDKPRVGEQAEGSEPAVSVENRVSPVGLLDDDESLCGAEAPAVNVKCQIREVCGPGLP